MNQGVSNYFSMMIEAVLWNRNYFLQFRFRLWKSYGSGSKFWKRYGSGSYLWKVTVPGPYLDYEKQIFSNKFLNFFCLFTVQIYCKLWSKIILDKGKQIHNLVPVPEP